MKEINFKMKTVIYLAVLLHLFLIPLPLVNLEWAFSDASLYFSTNKMIYLQQYFEIQANTLCIPFLSFLFNKIIPIIPYSYLPRLFSSLSLILLGAAIIKFNRLLKIKSNNLVFLLLIFLNPLIWTFSGRGTADFIPFALGFYSIMMYFDNKDIKFYKLLSLFLFGIAITIKYHTILLAPVFFIVNFFMKDQSLKKKLFQYIELLLIIISIPLFYIITIKLKFGFWLTPPIYFQRHGLNTRFFFSNFIVYFGFLGLFLAPFTFSNIIFYIKNTSLKTFFLIFILSLTFILLFGEYFYIPLGEMNFGFLDKYINQKVVGSIFSFFALFLLFTVYNYFKHYLYYLKTNDKNKIFISFFITSIIFIIILSFTRPTQRYLIFIIPFFYYIIDFNLYVKKYILYITLILYSIFDLFIFSNQYNTGIASKNMVDEIIKKKILNITEAGSIKAHAGNIFYPYNKNKKIYIIVEGYSKNSIFISKSNFLPFTSKTYSLIKL